MSKGFTLVEMLVVVLLIGLLAAVVAVNVTGPIGPSRATATVARIKQLKTALELFKLHHRRYPESLGDLAARPPYADPNQWPAGGYLEEVPRDGWGREFVYRVPGARGAPFDVVSWGEDGQPEGTGPAADLWSHPRGTPP
jgi:general secretion pathway protein G